ncbi:MAG: glutamate--cysteine ligase [Candidatus Sumerlaeia bacterium]|nr:glutamate--cysteine ligase [Candidatus Sumerlaeia bacterium]
MTAPLHLFEATGVELEYMIVDRTSLEVKPVCDALMEAAAGEPVSDVDRGPLSWSNELALHVVELKTNGPAATLDGLAAHFHAQTREIDGLLEPLAARLMPGAMHPWMDPHTQTRLWPHENGPIYQAYDRIFDCRGHGWSNVQSTHINLPFAGDDEFGRLHAAIRLVLPILPALAASSPFVDGRPTGLLDNRLDFYRNNERRLPAVPGRIIPEQVFTEADYFEQIYRRIDAEIARNDPDSVLNHNFLNSRGAIARFDRGAIEIRLLDIQECPHADLAIVGLVVALVRSLVEERTSSTADQRRASIDALAPILDACIREADGAVVAATDYLRLLGLPPAPIAAGQVWRLVAERLDGVPAECGAALETILAHGTLARRMLHAVPAQPTRADLAALQARLCACLVAGTAFVPDA